jgi:hypothetical protein
VRSDGSGSHLTQEIVPKQGVKPFYAIDQLQKLQAEQLALDSNSAGV